MEEVVKEYLPLGEKLWDWVETKDAQGCLVYIAEQTGLVDLASEPKQGRLVLTWEAKAIPRGKNFLEVHFMHQTQIQSF